MGHIWELCVNVGTLIVTVTQVCRVCISPLFLLLCWSYAYFIFMHYLTAVRQLVRVVRVLVQRVFFMLLPSSKAAYLLTGVLLLAVQRGAERFAHGQVRRGGGRLSKIFLRSFRTGHGIARFLGVPCGREYHHHSGQRQSPSLLNEASHPCRGGGQRAEGQGLPLPAAAVGTAGAARAILLHARDKPALDTDQRDDATSHGARLFAETTTPRGQRVGPEQLQEHTPPLTGVTAEVGEFL